MKYIKTFFYIILALCIVVILSSSYFVKSENSELVGPDNYKKGIPAPKVSNKSIGKLYAYLVFGDGTIHTYKVVNGVFIPIKSKTMKTWIGTKRIIIHPNKKYAYAVCHNDIIRFQITPDGLFVNPIRTVCYNVSENEYLIHPSGKYIYATTDSDPPSGKAKYSTEKFTIQSDGQPVLAKSEKIDVLHKMTISHKGNHLYAFNHNKHLQGYEIASNGSLSPFKIDNSNGSVYYPCSGMSLSNNGNNIFLCDADTGSLLMYSVDPKGKLSFVSGKRVINSLLGNTLESFIVSNDNILVQVCGPWLYSYRIVNNNMQKTGCFTISKDGTVKSGYDPYKYIKSTKEYFETCEKLSKIYSNEPKLIERSAIAEANRAIFSGIFSIKNAPDGFVYILTTSGVYRFQSTNKGLIYSGPAITWPDNQDIIYNPRNDANLKNSLQLTEDGMVFLEMK